MCGRFALHSSPEVIALSFGVSAPVPAFVPRYNIPPMTPVLAVREDRSGTRKCVMLRWGLVPHWARAPMLAAKLNNARAETVAEKPSFREAFRRRRCVIPASGFYEWKREGSRKQPYYVTPADGGLFAMAALWERWNGPRGEIETCAIVTTEANRRMSAIHDRMPVMIAAPDMERWLRAPTGRAVADLLRPCTDDAIRIVPVSTAVNRSSNDAPGLIEPLSASPE